MIKDGIINVYKPENMTSHDVVAIIRRAAGIKRVGHTGTLDPMATGVLPVCIGKAARVMEYLDMDLKTYRCTMKLGLITDTEDIWGEVLEERDFSKVTEEDVRKVLSSIHGVIDQKPPMYSAIKVNGKKLYEYAREGETVEVKTRKIYVKQIDVNYIDMESGQAEFTVVCTKGTYIRSICRDAGQALGCGAVMSGLERTGTGVFSVEGSTGVEEIRNMTPQQIEEIMYPVDSCLGNFGKMILDRDSSFRFVNGMRLSPEVGWNIVREPVYSQKDFFLPIREEYRHAYNVYGTLRDQEEFLGIGFVSKEDGSLKADKIFYVGR